MVFKASSPSTFQIWGRRPCHCFLRVGSVHPEEPGRELSLEISLFAEEPSCLTHSEVVACN